MQSNLDHCIKERILRLKFFCEKLYLSKKILIEKIKNQKSKTILIHEKAIDKFKLALEIFETEYEKNILNKDGRAFVRIIENKIDRKEKKYIKTIQSLEPEERDQGSQWLFRIEQKIVEKLII